MRKRAHLIDFLIERGVQWVLSRRNEYRNGARELSQRERSGLSLFFDSSTLDVVKVRSVSFIENPEFYKDIKDFKGPPLLDFSVAVGMTFNDTIAISERYLKPGPPPLSLLFHELVHVVQYQILGIEAFVGSYVRGWAEHGFEYDCIPLEVQAFALQQRYEANRDAEFSVSAELRPILRGG